MKLTRLLALLALLAAPPSARAEDKPIVLDGGAGPGKGKHVVLVSGDQEYRSEEAIPQLAKILSKHHGFKCTVLFTVDPKDGTVNPNISNVPGLDALKTADLFVVFTRFLKLPDDQMQHIADYIDAGKPVVGLRTSTHAFNDIPKTSPFARFNNGSGAPGWEGGFGKRVLGEKWVAHHGAHGKEGTRGVVVKGQEGHAILKGVAPGSVFGTTDVYTVTLPLPDCTPLLLGEVTETLKPDSPAVKNKKNDPMMPVAWTKAYKAAGDKTGRAFTTTMGASQDLEFEGTRRLIVNGCLWAAGLEDKIPEKANVDLVGEYKPTPFRFKGTAEWVKQPVKPADLVK
ncbi:ThuA domain-containing protein [Gemmata sp. JC673]|uniref:ThuA domain-containing protein n=1 Tax=Gemmata algarum TaxID=2975278 RepID=A0ABU5EXG2_9BACT|nr:ThuA domain-containing protein [Gemmata algarum]MDY3559639.1 ThuA domain-containing protein [Gemmata algarum]